MLHAELEIQLTEQNLFLWKKAPFIEAFEELLPWPDWTGHTKLSGDAFQVGG